MSRGIFDKTCNGIQYKHLSFRKSVFVFCFFKSKKYEQYVFTYELADKNKASPVLNDGNFQ